MEVGDRSPTVDTTELNRALQHGLRSLVDTQQQDGSWSGFCPGGPFSTCMTMVIEAYLGVLDERDAQEGARFLRGQQRNDGSFEDYPFAENGSVDATAMAVAALRVAGVAAEDPTLQRAEAWVAEHGGYEACITQNRVLLALAGLVDPSTLDVPSILYRLVPGVDRLSCRRMAVFMWVIFNAFNVVTVGLCRDSLRHASLLHPLRSLAARSLRRYFSRVQCPDGNWNGVIYTTLLGMLTLHFLGVANDDPRIQKALAKIREWKRYSDAGMEVVPFGADIWNTSVAVRALLLAGEPVESPPIRAGLDYLLRMQPDIPGPRHWQNPPKGLSIVGGWPFMPGNPYSPDLDSTGDVLWTLGLAHKAGAGNEVAAAAQRALDWLVAMQNPGGGWAGYTRGQRDKPPGPIFTEPVPEPHSLIEKIRMALSPPPEMLDCANVDITGRVLCTLEAHDLPKDHPAVIKAADFIHTQRWTNDLWWGRWEVNYLFGSAYALSGLAAAGADLKSPEIQRTVEVILGHQNSDGGWGESIDSYSDPQKAGIGPSSCALTGRLVAALVETGRGHLPEVARGIDYLLAQQQPDGLWRDDLTMWVVMPPAMFYINPVYTQYLALEGLIRYRQATSGASAA